LKINHLATLAEASMFFNKNIFLIFVNTAYYNVSFIY
jgi:hypothetical protein